MKNPDDSRGVDSPPSQSRHLARLVTRSRWEDMPEAARHEARRSILNFFGTALGGCRDRATETALHVMAPFAAAAEATVVGRPERMDILNAAFLNAISGNVFDFDDTHPRTIIHPTAPVAPALFALAERQRITGAALLHAFILGVEIECRLGNAISPGHYRRGWHITSTCGVFGAAAATAKCLRLEVERTIWALGNASAQSSGLVETLGSMAKSIGVGNAARNGLLSAMLAEKGFAGPKMPVEGPRGFLRVTGESPDWSALTEGLGQRWEICQNTYKPYPCGVVLNPVLDACLELRSAPGFSPERIASILVEGHPLLRERTDRPDVATGREAQVSAQHSVAVALLTGAAGVEQYCDAAVKNADVLRLRSKVQMADNPAFTIDGAQVTVSFQDGTEKRIHIDMARGSQSRPLTDAEIEAKVRQLAAYGCPDLDPEPLIAAVWSLDRAEDASACLRLARPR